MLSEFVPYLWICVGIAAAVVEVLTLSKVAVWFVPAALLAFLLAIFKAEVWIQTVVFIIISLMSVVLSSVISKKLKKIAKLKETQEIWEYKNLIGKSAIVTEEIDNGSNTGSVRINGKILSARAEDEIEIHELGSVVIIVEVETGADGNNLICAR